MSGYVYVVKSGKQFKIGFTTQSLDKRIGNLQTGSINKISLVMYFESDTPNLLEKQLHRKFASKRLDGEWFALSDSDIECLSGLDGAIINDFQEEDSVMIFKSGMNEIVNLGKIDPSASSLLMYVISNMDEDNCFMQSGDLIGEAVGLNLRSVRSKIKLLNDMGFIATLRCGNTNVYCVNSNIAWNNHINLLSESKFSATINLQQSSA